MSDEKASARFKIALMFARAAHGDAEALSFARPWVEKFSAIEGYSALAAAMGELLAGERDREQLLAPERGLDALDRQIVTLVYEAATDPAALERLTEQTMDAMPSSLSPEQQQASSAIGVALAGNPDARAFVEGQILPFMERPGSGFEDLAQVVRLLLAGDQRREYIQSLIDPLDNTDKAMLQLAFATSQQIQDEDRMEQELEDLRLSYTFALAALGNEHAEAAAQQLVVQIRAHPQGVALAAVGEALLAGQRDRAALLAPERNLDEAERLLLTRALDAIEDPDALERLQEQVAERQVAIEERRREQWAGIVANALTGDQMARQVVDQQLLPAWEHPQNASFAELARAVRMLFAGAPEEQLEAQVDLLSTIDRNCVKQIIGLARELGWR